MSQLTEWEINKSTNWARREKNKSESIDRQRDILNKKGHPTNLYEVPLKTHQVLQESGDMQTLSETFPRLSSAVSQAGLFSLLGGVNVKEAPEKQHVWVNNRLIVSKLLADLRKQTAIIFAAAKLQSSKHTWVELSEIIWLCSVTDEYIGDQQPEYLPPWIFALIQGGRNESWNTTMRWDNILMEFILHKDLLCRQMCTELASTLFFPSSKWRLKGNNTFTEWGFRVRLFNV